jgi:hypothetical protein
MSFGIELLLDFDNPEWRADSDGRTRDPRRDRKQIWLRYADIGARYGLKHP